MDNKDPGVKQNADSELKRFLDRQYKENNSTAKLRPVWRSFTNKENVYRLWKTKDLAPTAKLFAVEYLNKFF